MTPQDISNRALDFLVKGAQENSGSIFELCRRLTARTGKKVLRQQVELWLHPKKSKRVTPNLGFGLLLIDEGKSMLADKGSWDRTIKLDEVFSE